MDWGALGTSFLILVGAGVMLLSVFKTRGLLGVLAARPYVRQWRALFFFMLFFFAGYLAATASVLAGLRELVLVLTGLVFVGGALFVYLVVRLGAETIRDLLNQSGTISQMSEEMKQAQEAARESEERFRLIAENAADLIAMVDREGRRIYNNPSYQTILGYSPADLRGTSGLGQVLPEDRERVQRAAQQTMTEGKGQLIQYRMRHKDGSIRLLESISSPIRNSRGEVESIMLIARDITHRAEALAAQRRAEAMRQQNEYLAALHATALGLMSRLEPSDLLQTIVQRAGALVGTEHGYVFWREPGQAEYVMRVGVGVYSGFVGAQAQPGQGLAGTVIQTGEPLAVDDYPAWGGRLRDPSRDVLRAVVGVPLTSREQVVGVIGLAYLEEGRTFGLEVLDVLKRFAQLASIALSNAEAYATAQRELSERQKAEEELRRTQKFLDSVIENLPIMLFTKEASELRFTRWNRAGEELVGISRHEMVGKNDYDFWPKEQADWFVAKDREVLAAKRLVDIPEETIETRGRGLRYLHTRKIPILDEGGEPQYLLGISEDITEQRRMAESARRLNEYLGALHDTSLALMQRLETQALLQNVISRAGALVGTPHGYVYLQDARTGRFEMRVGVGVYAQLVGQRLIKGVGLAGKVWETGEPLVVDDYRAWPFRLTASNRDMLRAVVGLPLKSGDRVVGIIGLAHVDAEQRFGAAEMRVLDRFADLAAIALDNARLFEETQAALAETQRTADRQALLAAIADRLHAGTEVTRILQIAAEELRKSTGGKRAVARLDRGPRGPRAPADGNGGLAS